MQTRQKNICGAGDCEEACDDASGAAGAVPTLDELEYKLDTFGLLCHAPAIVVALKTAGDASGPVADMTDAAAAGIFVNFVR
jgi:hypothetical protein